MSAETEPWDPDAEPWEALREAITRVHDAGPRSPTLAGKCPAYVEALSEMGWRLVSTPVGPSGLGPGLVGISGREAENERLREESERRERSRLVAEDHCAHLMAENKRLKDEADANRRCGELEVDVCRWSAEWVDERNYKLDNPFTESTFFPGML